MSKEEDNKAIVGRWFTEFWGETCNLDIVDELAAPDMLLQYSLHAPRRGHADIKAFMSGFREAFRTSTSGALRISSPRRLCGWSLGRRRHAHRSGLQRLPDRIFASGDRPEDAVHRNDGASDRKRQDRRGDRSGRRRDRAPAARPHPRRLIQAGGRCQHRRQRLGWACPGLGHLTNFSPQPGQTSSLARLLPAGKGRRRVDKRNLGASFTQPPAP